jgi:hypothetical protein
MPGLRLHPGLLGPLVPVGDPPVPVAFLFWRHRRLTVRENADRPLNTADRLQILTVGWLMLRLTDGNALLTGTIVGIRTLPVLLIGPWAGVLADRINRRKLMSVTRSAWPPWALPSSCSQCARHTSRYRPPGALQSGATFWGNMLGQHEGGTHLHLEGSYNSTSDADHALTQLCVPAPGFPDAGVHF